MNFNNSLKGYLTQGLIKAVLEDAGYEVIRYGVEEKFPAVKNLDHEEYLNFGLLPAQRLAPDFIVADREVKVGLRVEVKYRKDWETAKQTLENKLKEQVKIYAPLYLILCLGDPAHPNSSEPAGRMGVVRLEINSSGKLVALDKDKAWQDLRWYDIYGLQCIFTKLRDRKNQQTLRKISMFFPVLAKLDDFE